MAGNVPIYFNQGGSELVIGSGGTLTAAAGSTINFDAGTVDIADNSITTGMLQNSAVTTAKIADSNVTTGKLAASAVTKAKALVFISTEQTANGMAQNVAHGLGVDPTGKILVVPSSNVGLMDGEFDIAWTANSTNVVVTATSGLTYYVMAWG